VCEHGAAKSILAATYFNHFAAELGLDRRATARGTSPDRELSPATVKGLSEDGLTPTESVPRPLTKMDLESTERVIAFCDLPGQEPRTTVEYWKDIPPVSEDYVKARDLIIERIRKLLEQ